MRPKPIFYWNKSDRLKSMCCVQNRKKNYLKLFITFDEDLFSDLFLFVMLLFRTFDVFFVSLCAALPSISFTRMKKKFYSFVINLFFCCCAVVRFMYLCIYYHFGIVYVHDFVENVQIE